MRNGLGLSAVIVGGIGILFGLVPLVFWISGPLALTAMALGFAGYGRVRRGEANNNNQAIIGILLGFVTGCLSVWGFVTTVTAFTEAF